MQIEEFQVEYGIHSLLRLESTLVLSIICNSLVFQFSVSVLHFEIESYKMTLIILQSCHVYKENAKPLLNTNFDTSFACFSPADCSTLCPDLTYTFLLNLTE